VLDATFLDPAHRARAEGTAKAAGVAFDGIWLQAPPAVLAARIAGRSGDASDATADTLRRQLARDVGPLAWTALDAGRPAEDVAEAWAASAAAPRP
jgi:predicted kinase